MVVYKRGASFEISPYRDNFDGKPEPAAMKTVEQNPTKLRFNVEDVDETVAELRQKGVATEVESYSWGTIANFTDPDGNLCSLWDEGRFR